jgi:hypothetical protein
VQDAEPRAPGLIGDDVLLANHLLFDVLRRMR